MCCQRGKAPSVRLRDGVPAAIAAGGPIWAMVPRLMAATANHTGPRYKDCADSRHLHVPIIPSGARIEIDARVLTTTSVRCWAKSIGGRRGCRPQVGARNETCGQHWANIDAGDDVRDRVKGPEPRLTARSFVQIIPQRRFGADFRTTLAPDVGATPRSKIVVSGARMMCMACAWRRGEREGERQRKEKEKDQHR